MTDICQIWRSQGEIEGLLPLGWQQHITWCNDDSGLDLLLQKTLLRSLNLLGKGYMVVLWTILTIILYIWNYQNKNYRNKAGPNYNLTTMFAVNFCI